MRKIRRTEFRLKKRKQRRNDDGYGEEQDGRSEGRVASGMACRAQGTAETREGVRVRWPERQRDAGRSFRRQEPADCVPLHVWSWVGGRLPELFVAVGSHRRQRRAPRSTRREPGGGFAGAAAANRGLQEEDGLAVQMGVVVRERLQPRLSRFIHRGGAGERRDVLQLCRAEIPERGRTRYERVL